MKSLRLVLRAAGHIVDPSVGQSVEAKLKAYGRAKIDAGLFTRASHDHPCVRRARDGLRDVIAHFETARADARPKRSHRCAPAEPVQRRVHDPRHQSPPTSVNRRCIAACVVRDKHRDAIGDTYPHRGRAVGGTRDNGVGLGIREVVERLDGAGCVDLFGLHDAPGVLDVQSRRESAVAAGSLWKCVTEPGANEKRGLQENHC